MKRVLAALMLASLLVPAVGATTNRAPYAGAGSDRTVSAWDGTTTQPEITFDAGTEATPPASFDQDGDTLTCYWYLDSATPNSASNPAPAFVFVGLATDCTTNLKVPPMPSGPVTNYDYNWVLFINDGVVASSPSPDYANHVGCSATTASGGPWYPDRMCDRFVVHLTEPSTAPSFASPAFSVSPSAGFDMVLDRGTLVKVYAVGVQDDYETRSVDVIFDGPATIRLSMQKTAPGPNGPFDRPETSSWYVEIPVNDARWRVGTYNVYLEARDDLNQMVQSDPTNFQYDVQTDAQVDGNLDLSVVEAGMVTVDYSGHSCVVQQDGQSVVVPATSGFALGRGQTLRVIALWPVVNAESTPGVPSDIFAGSVTYQTQLPTNTGVSRGPVVDLAKPYYIPLSLVDYHDQALLIKATDRLGGTDSVCVWLAVDLDAPFWIPDLPTTTFQGINFTVALYTRDTLRTIAALRIDDFNETTDPPVTYEGIIDGSLAVLPPGLSAVRMPAFGTGRDAAVTNILVDPASPGAAIQTCSIVLDLFTPYGPANFDTVLDPKTHDVHAIAPIAETSDGVATYGVDLNDDGQYDPGSTSTAPEPVIRAGVPSFPFRDLGRCSDPFSQHPELASFLADGPSQMFVWHLNRVRLGNADTTFRIQDLSHNRVAADYTYDYRLGSGGHASKDISLRGSFRTVKATVDARLVSSPDGTAQYNVGGRMADGLKCPTDLNDLSKPRVALLPGDVVCGILGVAYTTTMDPPPTTKLGVAALDERQRLLLSQAVAPLLGETAVLSFNKTFTAGPHDIFMAVEPQDFVDDSLAFNNQADLSFEVYAGAVVVNGGPAQGTYYIRATGPGVIREDEGAVTLDANGAVKDGFTVTQNQTLLRDGDHYVGTRFEFKVPLGENVTRTLYWDPNARANPQSLQTCGSNTTVDLKNCRPITILGAPAEAKAKKSPGPETMAAVVAVAAAVLVARRRRIA